MRRSRRSSPRPTTARTASSIPRSGETIAQGRYGLPVFLANMQFTVTNLIALVGKEGGFKPGDMWIVNDPYVSGTHLQDIVLVSPYFVDGELFALLASTGHWMDIGGSVPGGWAPKATEIHQEGTHHPADEAVRRRQAERAAGEDVHQQCAPAGPDRGRSLGDVQRVQCRPARARHAARDATDATRLSDCIAEMMDRSEAQMRSYIAEIPDGAYRFEDYFDNDGIVDEPVKLCLDAHQVRHRSQLRLHRHRRPDARADQPRAHHDAVELLRRAQAHLPGSAGERRRVPPDQIHHSGRTACWR